MTVCSLIVAGSSNIVLPLYQTAESHSCEDLESLFMCSCLLLYVSLVAQREPSDRAIAQAVGCRHLTRMPGFSLWAVHVGFVVEKVVLGHIYPSVLQFSAYRSTFHRCSMFILLLPVRGVVRTYTIMYYVRDTERFI